MKRLAMLALLAASCSPTHTGEVVVTKAATTTTLPKAHPRLVEMFKDRAARMTTTTTTTTAPVRVHAAAASPPTPAPTPAPPPPPPPPEEVTGRCGGDLPPCWVMQRESGGDIRIWNGGCYAPVGWTGRTAPDCPRARSSASGKWQVIRGTWGSRIADGQCIPGYAGYCNAADAPEDVQDDHARELWAGGAGCGHWNACP